MEHSVEIAAPVRNVPPNPGDDSRASHGAYLHLIDRFEQPITIYDDRGCIVHLNEHAALYLGVSAKECVGRSFSDFIPNLHELAIQRSREVLAANEARRYEDRVPLPTGGAGWFLSDVSPINWRDWPRPTVQTISYDITSLRMAEAREQDQQLIAP